QLPARAVGRDAQARAARAVAGPRSVGAADGRAVQRPRRPDAQSHGERAPQRLESRGVLGGRSPPDCALHHARSRGGDRALGRDRRHDCRPRDDQGALPGRPPPPSERHRDPLRARVRGPVRARLGGPARRGRALVQAQPRGRMSTLDLTATTAVPLTRRTWFVRTIQLAVIAFFIGAWEVLGQAGILDKFYYSRPSLFVPRIGGWFAEGLGQGAIYRDIGITLLETILGFVIGTLLGVAIGYLFARNELLGKAFDPLLSMFNAIPRLVLAPVFILAFGIDLQSKVALGVTLVFFIVFFATFTAIRDVDQTLVDNVRVLGARRRDVTSQVLLPAAFSAIVASLRTSAGFAFAGAVVAEYIGSNAGLGRRIATAEAFFDSTGVFGGIVLIAALALLLDAGLQLAEGAFSRWKPRREH